MNIRPLVSVALLAALAACAVPPQTQLPQVAQKLAATVAGIPADGQAYASGNTYRIQAVEELPIVGATASSATSAYAPSRAIDGDLSTQWVDGGYRNATSWLAVQLAATATIGSIDIKTGPMPAGTSYDVQVSANGTTWTTVRIGMSNSTWNLETKTLPDGTTGKYVRILWGNSTSSPQAHFAVYELNVNGEGTAVPSPTPTLMPSPVPTASPTAPPSTPPGGTPTKASPSTVAASSTYSGLTPQRATDGNLSTQWSNGGYKDASAWLRLGFASTQSFSSIRIKTGAPPAGVSYVVEVSNDGTTWTAASGPLTNTTWNMEPKAISGTGKFLRVRFTNSTSFPVARFSVYEVEAFAAAAAVVGCETASIGGDIFEPGSPAGGPPTYTLSLGVTKHDQTATGGFGSFNLSYATASGYYEGVATSLTIVGNELTVRGTATVVDGSGRHYVGDWTLKGLVERGPDGIFGGKVTALTVGGEMVAIDPTRAPTISGVVDDCTPDPRNCLSISNDSALLFPSEGSNDPHGELLINSLMRTASSTSGSITFSGYSGRPSFTGIVQTAAFTGDRITFGGNVSGGGTFSFEGIVHGYEVSAPESWELAPLKFRATDGAGNTRINIDPGTIMPSLTGGYAVLIGCN